MTFNLIYETSSNFLFYLRSVDKQMAENLAQDMADLMHDYEVVSRYRFMSSRKTLKTII